MDSRTQERVERWDSRPFADGIEELHTLEHQGFSGAVTAAGAWLFMLNGRIVGIVDGDLNAFDGATGTIFEAPDPALPLLFSMQERGGETRAKYYTVETPISEVDRTLQSGSFTGYIELSEDVLSGDYYVTYYGGRSMSVAYIGTSERLLTGDEAFERADDEVGIFTVMDCDVEVIDLPGSGRASPTAEPEATEEPPEVTDADDSPSSSGSEGASGDDPEAPSGSSDPVATDDAQPAAADESARDADQEVTAAPSSDEEGTTSPDDTGSSAVADVEADASASDDEDDDSLQSIVEEAEAAMDDVLESTADAEDDPSERFIEEQQWRETRRIPSIDPERTAEGDPPGRSQSAHAAGSTQSSSAGAVQSRSPPQQRAEPAPDQPDERDGSNALKQSMLEREDMIDQLQQRVDALERERDSLAEERDRLRSENEELSSTVDELETKISSLEAELEQLRSELGRDPMGETGSLTPAQALEGTNLFVRYASKSAPTLASAYEATAEADEVNQNLRLEYHTQFDEDNVQVAGEPFDEFLTGSIEYQFVDWLIRTAVYEIRDTGNADRLGDLFDVIPAIDRAEIRGVVAREYEADGESVRDTETFDVVVRDRMGHPLVVANINDSRDPATESMMEELAERASRSKESNQRLGAAFMVTSSFFEPDALEAAAEATSGSFLSRDSKLSYVKLTRKQGYHLCLVETRGGEFHLTIPEL